MNKWRAYLEYACQNRITTLIFIALLAIFLAYDWSTGWQFLDTEKTKWDQDISQLVTFATFFVAIAVWWAELTQEWRNQLPKRLTVDFVYIEKSSEEGEVKKVMRCEKAHLSDTADIRALGQQIGAQIAKSQLDFRAPYVTQKEEPIEYDNEIGFFRHYYVIFTLTTLPSGITSSECKVWKPPFDSKSLNVC